MRKVIDFEALKLIEKIKKMSPDELKDALCSEELKDALMSNCSPDELTFITASDSIAGKASGSISKTISKKHGKVSESNPPTVERRDDYCHLCLSVASHIFSRALAMYEPEDRAKLIEDFMLLTIAEATLIRHEVDGKNINEPEHDDE